MSKCKHENADHLMPGDYYSNGRPHETIVVTVEQFRCADCGHWLSLGPSNDEPEEVRVEIEAARYADGAVRTNAELPADGTPWFCPFDDIETPCDICQAVQLAIAIVTHEADAISHSASTAGGGE